jgi:hypothetical protein
MLAARRSDDWWSTPLESALATVSLTRHASVYRPDAQKSLDRIRRWWREGRSRRTSSDAAALALAARAVDNLRLDDPNIMSAAVRAVEDSARRNRTVTPELHLALAAWALDPVVGDRDAAPWPAIRERSREGAQSATNTLLASYVDGVAQRSFDWAELIEEVGRKIASTTVGSDACVLAWLLAIMCEKASSLFPEKNSGVQLLFRRRSELVERLAGEIDDGSFRGPELYELEEDPESESEIRPSLSSFEAALLDFSLASQQEIQPWLTFEEADRFFRDRNAEERVKATDARLRLLRSIRLLISALGLVAGIALWEILRRLKIEPSVANYSAAAVLALALSIMTGVSGWKQEESPLAEPFGILFISVCLVAAAAAVNQSLKKPYVSDTGGLVAGSLIAVGPVMLWAVIRWLGRRR